MTERATNVLYYGDNVDIPRRYLPDGRVDLIYLDPPFISNHGYNVIFKRRVCAGLGCRLASTQDG